MLSVILLSALAQPSPQPAPDKAGSLVPFPHPLITEVLYNVPPGPEGDANGDGVRSATGDEFVELINPHDKPINLKGYTLTDGLNAKRPDPPARPSGKKPNSPAKEGEPTKPAKPERVSDDDSRVRFTFPDITLQPGQVVVVFNGYAAKPAPKGTPDAPPKAPPAEPKPGEKPGAVRLSMEITSEYAAFGNSGDCVLLADPEGKAVQCITWGADTKPPENFAPLIERAPEGRFQGSVTRTGAAAKGLIAHKDQVGDLKGLPYSPGVFEPAPAKK